MARRKVDPESRRADFMLNAEELFLEKGFENTSIDDLVGRMGVAKGLFYYYFDSKEELIMAISEQFMREIDDRVKGVMSAPGLSAMQRIESLSNFDEYIQARARMMSSYFHRERNRAVHLAMEERSLRTMIPFLESIIEQGNQEGIMKVDHPRETAIMMTGAIAALKHRTEMPRDLEGMIAKSRIMEDLVERMLGMAPGSFTLFSRSADQHFQMIVDKNR